MDWQDFFKINTDYIIPIHNFEDAKGIDLEDVYQAFKARLVNELNLKTESPVTHLTIRTKEFA